jgi:hypothetical protein
MRTGRTTYVAPAETETHEGGAAGGGDASIGAGTAGLQNRHGAVQAESAIAAATPSSAAAVSNETESVGSQAPLTSPTDTVSASKP